MPFKDTKAAKVIEIESLYRLNIFKKINYFTFLG